MKQAVKDKSGKVILHLKVKTGRKKNKFPSGYDEWRKRICIDVIAYPHEGRANREVISTLKTFFGCDAMLISGEKSKEKDVFVEMEKKKVLNKLKHGL